MVCTPPTWIWKYEPTTLVNASVEFTEYSTGTQNVYYDITLPWGDARQLVLRIGEKKEYADPDSNMIWSLVASEYDVEEDKVMVVCCHGTIETDQILTLYFRPWSWTSIDGVAADVANKTIEIEGAITNALSDYTGYEYVSHEIAKETMEGRTREYIAVHIYINDTSSAHSVQFIPAALAIKLGIAIVIVVLALGIIVGWKLKSAADSERFIILEQEVAELTKTVNELTSERDGDAFVSGEISGEEYMTILYNAIRENKETANLLHLDPSTFNEYELCVNTAIDVYQSSGKTQADKTSLRESRDICENTFNLLMTDEVNAREPAPFLPDMGMNEWLTYLMYGGIAIGGLLAITMTTQLIDTIGGNNR